MAKSQKPKNDSASEPKIDSISRWMARKTLEWLSQERKKRKINDLADKTHIPRKRMYKLLDLEGSGYRGWFPDEVYAVSKVTGIRPPYEPAPAGILVDPLAPRSLDGSQLFHQFIPHYSSTQRTFAFQRFLPYPLMTKEILPLHLAELVGHSKSAHQRRLFTFYSQHADTRKEKFFNQGIGTDTITFMFEDDFEKFIKSDYPYERCKNFQVKQCLKHILDTCIKGLGFQFHLINAGEVREDVRRALLRYDMVGFVGQRLVIKRQQNHAAFITTDPMEVVKAAMYFEELERVRVENQRNTSDTWIRLTIYRKKL